MKRLATAALVAVGMLAASVSTAGATTYSLLELFPIDGGSSSNAQGVNNSGEVVGNSSTPNGRATYWDTSGAPTSIEPLPGDTLSSGRDINDGGDVLLGNAVPGRVGTATKENINTGVQTILNPLSGYSDSIGFAINGSGEVAGLSSSSGISNLATFWSSSGDATILNPLAGYSGSVAQGLNSAGDVVGSSGSVATKWLSGSHDPSNLGNLIGGTRSNAWDINDNGLVVGYGNDLLSDWAILWDAGGPTNLGAIDGASGSSAHAINNAGDIVGISSTSSGNRATLWSEGLAIDLTNVLDQSALGWVLREAYGINESGQIIGFGESPQGRVHAFLLTPNPVPLPAAFPLLGAALSLLGLFGWRRKRMAAA